ncbi:MAG: ATP-binding protein [Brevundimonas sp.]|uniref:ATP-binding protein n=1 Tax=Brevundimonas sp. TaxID=1871086 RepID=UPI0027366973|nr:ATP-binding protein [Brevundimonas sp.]MDP3405383.1 ATP-binding protein [Brevundimonas sp.]
MSYTSEYVRAYAGQYRDMFAVRIASILGIVILIAVVRGPVWAAGFGVIQLALYVVLWAVVTRARTAPDRPAAGLTLKRATEIITFLLATHNAVFVLLAWQLEAIRLPPLLLLIVGNLMVGALQVHMSRLSFTAAAVPPSIVIGLMAWQEAASDGVLLACTALFVVGVVTAASRQALSDRQTVDLVVNLTERSEALERALADAERQRVAAERADQAKSRFLAMISHEVRTPLNVILGITEVLKRRKRPAAEAGLITDMADAGGLLMRLLNGALDLSRIESGQVDVRLAPVDIRTRVEAVARVWRAQAEDQGLTLTVECDGAPEHFLVQTDEARIEQVLINLLSNALKMTPSGTVAIVVRARPGATGAIDLTFEVQDHGPGVPEDQRERIFQPFEQLEDGRTAGGAGLGLAICRASVGALGGTLGVRDAEQHGSVFWFRLEAAPAEGTAPVPTTPADDEAPRLSVLAAEDHPANRKLLSLLLPTFGVELTLVENGAEAVAAVGSGTFDLVLMDAMMPVMDGVEAVRTIRAEEAASGRPRRLIHMLTANVFEEDIARYMAAGADGVLKKPIDLPALHAVLAEAAVRHRT